MKKTIIISLMLLITASLVFGENFYGRQDNNNSKGMNNTQELSRQDNRRGPGEEMVVEILELSGKITVNENSFPTLKAGKKELSLLIGQRVLKTLKLKSGDSVTIKGFKVPGPNWSVDEQSALKVRELTVNGKTYQIMGRGHMNGGPGMMNRRSNGMDDDNYRNESGNYGTRKNK